MLCLPVGNWLNKLLYIYTTERGAVFKKNELGLCSHGRSFKILCLDG